ncbi:MAG: hypothetical protein MJ229_01640 [bacterium]|nr:hypothetical protein [bacterium]
MQKLLSSLITLSIIIIGAQAANAASVYDSLNDALNKVDSALNKANTAVSKIKETSSNAANAKATSITNMQNRKNEALKIYNTEKTAISNAITSTKNSTILNDVDKKYLTKIYELELKATTKKYSVIETYYDKQIKSLSK